MSVIKKVRTVEQIYGKLEKEISQFQQKTNFTCLDNCHSCCTKKNIEASSLEFLPLAYYLYKTHQAYSFLEKLAQNTNPAICILFNPLHPGRACTHYKYRGLVCRLFGSSAMINKSELCNLITCKQLKTEKSSEYRNAQHLIHNGLPVPLSSKYYMELYSLDLKLSSRYYSINKAIEQALETILFYFSFSDKQAG